MIIIDHGDHYYSVYAHAEELFKKTGDGVERNEVIATVGDAGSLSGSMLHFEIRQQGKPVDPMLWVKSG
jgi:septal ring factor EnvC (AmiA/AmiB activator)